MKEHRLFESEMAQEFAFPATTPHPRRLQNGQNCGKKEREKNDKKKGGKS